MAQVYNFEGIKKELENRREEASARLEAWRQVKRLTKKDGSDFAIFSKNFEGLSHTPSANDIYPCISITTRADFRYISDDINIYLYVDEMSEEEKQPRAGIFHRFNSYTRDVYHMTIDEVFSEAISKRIAYLTDYIDCLNMQLEAIEQAYIDYLKALEETSANLKKAVIFNPSNSKYPHQDSYYLIREVVNRMYL